MNVLEVMDTKITDCRGVPIFEGDRVSVSWLADIGVTELDCEAIGTVEYMADKRTAAYFVKFDKPYKVNVCEEGHYEEENFMLMQADEDMCVSFLKITGNTETSADSPKAST